MEDKDIRLIVIKEKVSVEEALHTVLQYLFELKGFQPEKQLNINNGDLQLLNFMYQSAKQHFKEKLEVWDVLSKEGAYLYSY
jgi:hypothetical protein